jgi:hypothetical protein
MKIKTKSLDIDITFSPVLIPISYLAGAWLTYGWTYHNWVDPKTTPDSFPPELTAFIDGAAWPLFWFFWTSWRVFQ